MRNPISTLCFTTALALVLGACAAPPVPVHHEGLGDPRFTRHCLRGKQDGEVRVMYSNNYLSFPDVAGPGTEAVITMYSGQQIDMTLDGLPCRMLPFTGKFPTDAAGIDAFLDRHFSDTLPEIPGDDEGLLKQIQSGIAPIGATREQVMCALGYPTHIDAEVPADTLSPERIMESNQWTYRWADIAFFPVLHIYQFGTDGTLTNVIR